MVVSNAMEASKLQKQNIYYTERRFQLEIQHLEDPPHIVTLAAWAILSAVYSTDSEASIEFWDPEQQPRGFQIKFYLDASRSVQDVLDELQGKLDSGHEELVSGSNSPNIAYETEEINFGLPAPLIVRNIDVTVYKHILEHSYNLAIAMEVDEHDGGKLCLNTCYSNKVDERDVDLLQTRISKLISQLIDRKDRKISHLSLITAFDKQQFEALNESMPPTVHAFVHEIIELQAEQYPHNEAVCAWDGSLSYKELEQRATCLAKNLVQRGVGSGSWVPLLFEKSKWHIVSMLAVREP